MSSKRCCRVCMFESANLRTYLFELKNKNSIAVENPFSEEEATYFPLLLNLYNNCYYRNSRNYINGTIYLQTFILAHTGAACRSEENFWRAREYLPERWTSVREPHSVGLVAPFGRGRRMCPGKRFVELELQLLLAKV